MQFKAHNFLCCVFFFCLSSKAKENGQKDKQRSTKHTHKTKDRVTPTSLKIGDELKCSGRVSSSCSTSTIHRVNLVTNPVMNEERTGKCLRQVEHIHGDLWHRYSVAVSQVMVAKAKLLKRWQALEYRINLDIYTPMHVLLECCYI